MLFSERMSGVDRAWLLMDRPSNPMTVVALVVLEEVLELAVLKRLLRQRFLAFRRFKCLPVIDGSGARWIEFEDFQLDDHVHHMALPEGSEGSDQTALEELVGELASAPLSPARPRWSFHLIEHYAGGSALVVRIHHCYADGIALRHVLLSLCGSAGGKEHSGGSALYENATSLGGIWRDVGDLIEKGVHYATHPLESRAAAQQALSLAAELGHIGLMADDPATLLKRPLSGVKRVAWAQALALEEVHTIGRLLGCTVNDVLVSNLAGAVGGYLEKHGQSVSGLTLRAAVPANLREHNLPEQSGPMSMGNSFGLVFVDLPIGVRHPLERLYSVRKSMQALKASPQAMATLGLMALVGNLPSAAEELVISLLSAKVSLVASNVPGPDKPLRLGGIGVSQLLFWVPQTGSVGTGVSMLTYCGRVHLGVISDRNLIPDPDELAKGMATEFERLVFLVLLGAGSLSD
jgi:WS/DGAT/MGAT family acyltransferase